jgi:hypothetical protein
MQCDPLAVSWISGKAGGRAVRSWQHLADPAGRPGRSQDEIRGASLAAGYVNACRW